jgi:putative mRNA 3-end processing factor
VFDEINSWWRSNQREGKASLLFAYSLGKAQRLLAGLDPEIGPIWLHGAMLQLVQDYRDCGVMLPPTRYVAEADKKMDWSKSIILAPPSTLNTAWAKKFNPVSTAFASGWMQIRGTRRRKAVDRGFVLSDHADWNGLLDAIKATAAQRVWVTHGYVTQLVRHLQEIGLDAKTVMTSYEGERDDLAEEQPSLEEQLGPVELASTSETTLGEQASGVDQ